MPYFFQCLNFLFSYRGLREYKSKFTTHWEPRYAIYRKPLDLPRLAGGIGVAALFVPLPRSLLEGGDIPGVAMLLATGLVIYLVFRKPQAIREEKPAGFTGWKPLRWVYSILGHLRGGPAKWALRGPSTWPSVFLSFFC